MAAKSMPWIKVMSEAARDPKLRALSREAHFIWFQLLCMSGEQEDRGVIYWKNDKVFAIDVGCTVEELNRGIEECIDLELMEWAETTSYESGGDVVATIPNRHGVYFPKWSRYQRTSEEAAERSRIASENGKKGGRPRKNEQNRPDENQTESKVKPNETKPKAKKAYIEEEVEVDREEECVSLTPSQVDTPAPVENPHTHKWKWSERDRLYTCCTDKTSQSIIEDFSDDLKDNAVRESEFNKWVKVRLGNGSLEVRKRSGPCKWCGGSGVKVIEGQEEPCPGCKGGKG